LIQSRARVAVRVALILLALWPLAQMTLVGAFDVNPWKLAGWGMYAAPQLEPRVSIECITPDEAGRYELHTVSPDWRRELEKFVWRRRGLGRLARPDALGRKLLELYPTILGVEITVAQPVMDARTGMIVDRSMTYSYARSR
jgi:hypothetical protein